MALEYVSKWFSKVGRGIPQTHQRDSETGTPLFQDKENTVPLMGNEQYQANQLVTVNTEDPEAFLAEALEACEGDIALVSKSFLNGFNKYLRLKAGGLDEYQKAARNILKLGLEQFKGLSEEQIAEFLKNAEVKQG